MICQRQILPGGEHFIQQRFYKVKQVIYLFEFASAVLIEFAVTRQYMQLFEQFNGLVGFDFVNLIHVVLFCFSRTCFSLPTLPPPMPA